MNPTPSSSSSTVLTFRHESPAGISPEQRNSQTPGPTVPLLQISQTHRPLRFKEKFQALREKYDQVTVDLQLTKKKLATATAKEQKMQAELDALLDAVLMSEAAASLTEYAQMTPFLDRAGNGVPYREEHPSMEAERDYARRREIEMEREREYLERERGLEYAEREREMQLERERDRERQMEIEMERDRHTERSERERERERDRERELQREDMEHAFYANGGAAAPRSNGRRNGRSREYGELAAWRAQPEPENPPPLRYVHEYSEANGRAPGP